MEQLPAGTSTLLFLGNAPASITFKSMMRCSKDPERIDCKNGITGGNNRATLMLGHSGTKTAALKALSIDSFDSAPAFCVL